MPNVEQITFSHKELVETLLKSQGITEGLWMPLLAVSFAAGNFSVEEGVANPGGIVMIQKIGIARAQPDTPTNLIVDASKLG